VPLDTITGLQTRRSEGIGGRLGGQSLLVTTADGTTHRFSVRLDRWSGDLARALMARGHDIRAVPDGMTVAAATAGLLHSPAAGGTPPGLPPAWLAGEPPSSVQEDPARRADLPAGALYTTGQQEPPREPRRVGLIIGIAVVLLALAGIGVGLAVQGSGAASVGLPGRLLGLSRYTGPGAWIDNARLDRQLTADAHGNLVRVTAAIYGSGSGSSPGILVAEGTLCGTCAANQSATGMLARAPAGARTFPPVPGGGTLVCFPYSATGHAAIVCSWLASDTRTAGVIVYAGGAASGLADAAAKTRQILALTHY
jgi:hypothetical protein